MDKIVNYNAKDLRVLYFKVDGRTRLEMQHIKGNQMIADEKSKLEAKGALIVETRIEDLIQDFGKSVTIMYLPKGKYKYE